MEQDQYPFQESTIGNDSDQIAYLDGEGLIESSDQNKPTGGNPTDYGSNNQIHSRKLDKKVVPMSEESLRLAGKGGPGSAGQPNGDQNKNQTGEIYGFGGNLPKRNIKSNTICKQQGSSGNPNTGPYYTRGQTPMRKNFNIKQANINHANPPKAGYGVQKNTLIGNGNGDSAKKPE